MTSAFIHALTLLASASDVSNAVVSSKNDAICKQDLDNYCLENLVFVDLEHEHPKYIRINTALGDAVVLLLQDGLEVKQCAGSGKDSKDWYCGLDNGNGAIFDVKSVDNKVTIYPKTPAGLEQSESPTEALAAEHGNLSVVTSTGLSLNIDMRITDASKSVRQVVVRAPKLAGEKLAFEQRCTEHMVSESSRLQQGWSNLTTRTDAIAAEKMTADIVRGRHCRKSTWTQMHDLLWVQANSICQLGDSVYVTFEIENRAKDSRFAPESIALSMGTSNDDDVSVIETEALVFIQTSVDDLGNSKTKTVGVKDVALGFGERIEGGIRVAAKGLPKIVSLNIAEHGGAQRSVAIKGIQF